MSLFGIRKAARSWGEAWQKVLIDSSFEIGTWSPAIVCCRERELCGFDHGDDFISRVIQCNWRGPNQGSLKS